MLDQFFKITKLLSAYVASRSPWLLSLLTDLWPDIWFLLRVVLKQRIAFWNSLAVSILVNFCFLIMIRFSMLDEIFVRIKAFPANVADRSCQFFEFHFCVLGLRPLIYFQNLLFFLLFQDFFGQLLLNRLMVWLVLDHLFFLWK